MCVCVYILMAKCLSSIDRQFNVELTNFVCILIRFGSPCSIMANVLDCDIAVQTLNVLILLGKTQTLLFTCYGLNRITILLKGCLWH